MTDLAQHLIGIDRRWERVIATHAPFKVPRSRWSDFEAVVRSIVYQQLAGKAAASIHARLVDGFGGALEPDAVARARPGKLRAAGLSEAKTTAIKGLALAITSGDLDLAALRRAPDEEIERALCALHGIGPWTAHMVLIFHLRRPDVWPTGDYGVRVGFQKIFELAELPAPRALVELGEPYRPHRSAVAWYCWRAVEGARANGST